jgi:hypothetical protein
VSGWFSRQVWKGLIRLALLALLLSPRYGPASITQATQCTPTVGGCPLEFDIPSSATFEPDAPVHLWWVTVTELGDIHIILRSEPIDLRVYVYGPNGDDLGEVDHPGREGEDLRIPVAQPGRYAVYVDSPRGEFTGESYVLVATAARLVQIVEPTLLPTPRTTIGPTPTPQIARFTSVSAGVNHSCGVRTDESVACWGDNTWGQSSPPSGRFKMVSAGSNYSCGLRLDSSLTCWGLNSYGGASPPLGTFTTVNARYYTCGIRVDATLVCWGDLELMSVRPPSGHFTSVSIGNQHNCAIKTEGTVACWGHNEFPSWRSTPPDGIFTTLGAGEEHTCGLRANGAINCWGGYINGERNLPSGTFIALSVGFYHNCAVRIDQTAVCWGGSNNLGEASPPTGDVSSVSPGLDHSCGVRTNGTVVCWGSNDSGKATPPVI